MSVCDSLVAVANAMQSDRTFFFSSLPFLSFSCFFFSIALIRVYVSLRVCGAVVGFLSVWLCIVLPFSFRSSGFGPFAQRAFRSGRVTLILYYLQLHA